MSNDTTNYSPKGDKFAAMAARQQQSIGLNEEESSNVLMSTQVISTAAPKRDKLASMVAAAAASSCVPTVPTTNAEQENESTSATETTRTTTTTTTTANVQQQQQQPRRDKFAAVQEQKRVVMEEQQRKTLDERCRQRDMVWQDLDRAEINVLEVLQLAQATSELLSQKTVEETTTTATTTNNNNKESELDLEELVRKYQDRVSEIHSLLKPHAQHVVAYKAPDDVNRMYLQRVEHRIAASKRDLLRDLLWMEQNGDGNTYDAANGQEQTGKRKRSENGE